MNETIFTYSNFSVVAHILDFRGILDTWHILYLSLYGQCLFKNCKIEKIFISRAFLQSLLTVCIHNLYSSVRSYVIYMTFESPKNKLCFTMNQLLKTLPSKITQKPSSKDYFLYSRNLFLNNSMQVFVWCYP